MKEWLFNVCFAVILGHPCYDKKNQVFKCPGRLGQHRKALCMLYSRKVKTVQLCTEGTDTSVEAHMIYLRLLHQQPTME